MQHLEIRKQKCSNKRIYHERVQISIPTNIINLFDQKMKEREEKNRSQLIEFLMVCWIYSYDDRCKECPFYEGENEETES